MLHTPKHITNANIATEEILFEWDEWNVQPYFQGCTDDIEDMLQMLSDRGNMALAIACAEWVYHPKAAVKSAERSFANAKKRTHEIKGGKSTITNGFFQSPGGKSKHVAACSKGSAVG